MKIWAIGFIFLSLSLGAQDIDITLRKHIDFFGIKPLVRPLVPPNGPLYVLGRHLFIAPIVAGNRNINCLTCHDPKMGTSDNKRLSQTHDGRGVLKRNSQQLFNVGLPSRVHMFWDGRVSFDPKTNEFSTPEEALNGATPLRSDITSVMTSALSMQAIFPMVSHEEMRGAVGENDVANAKTNLEAWEIIVNRLVRHRVFKVQLEKAFPGVTQFNIGHVGEALAQFMREEFYSDGSPFHRYVAGDHNAMTSRQKEGMRVFIERGKCIACHQGGELGHATFYASVGVPQFGARPFNPDYGRAEVKGNDFRKYFFRTPSLLNLKVTAPYYHNGSFTTIREVINHYSNIKESLDNYVLSAEDRAAMPVEVEILNDEVSKSEIFSAIKAPFLRNGLHLTEPEKDALEDFLTNALMDPKFEVRPSLR